MARKKLGKLPPRDEAEIDAAAIVTPQDIDEAKAHARQHGTWRFIALQEAERETQSEST
jgi:hypothetical protein